jgi:hypothetical protein
VRTLHFPSSPLRSRCRWTQFDSIRGEKQLTPAAGRDISEKSAKIFWAGEKIFINLAATEVYGGTIFAAMLGVRAKCSF